MVDEGGAKRSSGRVRELAAGLFTTALVGAAFALVFGVVDSATVDSAAGDLYVRNGAIGVVVSLLGLVVSRPRERGSWTRILVVGTGVWSFLAFGVFISWRIALSAEQLEHCESGDYVACFELGERKRKRGDMETAAQLFRMGCEGEEGRACLALASAVDGDEALSLQIDACTYDVALGCLRAGTTLKRAGELERARELFVAACEGGEHSGCAELELLDAD